MLRILTNESKGRFFLLFFFFVISIASIFFYLEKFYSSNDWKILTDFLFNWFLDAVICPTEVHFGRCTEQGWNDMRTFWKDRILENFNLCFSGCQCWKALACEIKIFEKWCLSALHAISAGRRTWQIPYWAFTVLPDKAFIRSRRDQNFCIIFSNKIFIIIK